MAPADRPESWQVHGTEDIWRGAAPFAVRSDRISAPARPDEQFGRLVLEHPGPSPCSRSTTATGCWSSSSTGTGRHPLRRAPCGTAGRGGGGPLVTAQRELREEAGLVAQRWTHLMSTYPSPGLSSERIEIYLAEDVSETDDRGGFVLEHEEADMTTAWVPVGELLEGVLAGRLTEGPLALAVLLYTHQDRHRAGR